MNDESPAWSLFIKEASELDFLFIIIFLEEYDAVFP